MEHQWWDGSHPGLLREECLRPGEGRENLNPCCDMTQPGYLTNPFPNTLIQLVLSAHPVGQA